MANWDGSYDDLWDPTQITGITTCSYVSAGTSFSLILESGNLFCGTGTNVNGQLGDGTTDDKANFNCISLPVIAQISTSGSHTLLLKSDGTIWAWGYNWLGQLGDGTTTDRHAPVQIGTDTNWESVIAGTYYTSYATKTDGTLWAWGYNWSGQLGDGTEDDKLSPIQIGMDADWSQIASGYGYVLAIKTNGALWAWGAGNWGQLGTGDSRTQLSPVQIGTDTNWKQVSAGNWPSQSLGIKTDGTLWIWGYPYHGDGNGNYGLLYTPTQIGIGTNWFQAIAGGDASSLALKSDGTLWGWGDNSVGQLGDGTTTSKTVPTQISGISNYTQIVSSGFTSFILKADNEYCGTGYNYYGQLGDGTTTDKSTFTCVNFPIELKSAPVDSDKPEISQTGKSYLKQNYPNPTQDVTTIEYYLSEKVTNAKIVLYNFTGSVIKEYSVAGQGASSINIDISNLPAGMYTYALITNSTRVDVKKLILAK